MKKLFAMILALCFVFGIIACGGNAGSNGGDTTAATENKLISGKYVLCEVDMAGEVMDKAALEEFGMLDNFSITFNGDGTGFFRVEGEDYEMEYNEKAIIDPIYAEEEGEVEEIPYELKDGKLVVDFGDGQLFYYELAN